MHAAGLHISRSTWYRDHTHAERTRVRVSQENIARDGTSQQSHEMCDPSNRTLPQDDAPKPPSLPARVCRRTRPVLRILLGVLLHVGIVRVDEPELRRDGSDAAAALIPHLQVAGGAGKDDEEWAERNHEGRALLELRRVRRLEKDDLELQSRPPKTKSTTFAPPRRITIHARPTHPSVEGVACDCTVVNVSKHDRFRNGGQAMSTHRSC